MRKLGFSLVLIIVLAFVFGCSHAVKQSGPQGVYHHVKKGETLWSISRAYNVGIQQIAESNKITNVSQIKENTVLFIPGAERTIDFTQKTAAMQPDTAEEEPPGEPEDVTSGPRITTKDLVDPEPAPAAPGKSGKTGPGPVGVPVKTPAKPESKAAGPSPADTPVKTPVKPAIKPESKPSENKADKKLENKPAENVIPPGKPVQEHSGIDNKKLAWPVRGSVASKYGIQPNGMKINGIKILAPDSAPIVASAAGAVIHSANIKYYGDTVIIKHDENFSTVYCYLKDRTVKVGDIVKKGDRIALVGKPENGDGKSYLHFEVRYRSKPRDPLLYLP